LKIIVLITFAVSLSCGLRVERCGSGIYYCSKLISSRPYLRPVHQIGEGYRPWMLLADGKVIGNEGQTHVFDLKQLCSADTIVFADIFPDEDFIDLDSRVIAISSSAIYDIDNFNNVVAQFGDSGPDSTRLHRVIHASLGEDKIYVIDAADSTIKIFDYYGQHVQTTRACSDPQRIKCYDEHVWLLDRSDESIREYNSQLQPSGRFLSNDLFNDIVDFDIASGLLVVADHGGTRVVVVTLDGEIIDDKSTYCCKYIDFELGRVIDIRSTYFGFNLVDIENSFLIYFGDSEMEKAVPVLW
jgi:hypothetical protein